MFKPHDSAANMKHQLDPRFGYLRLIQDKREIFLALGYIDPRPDGDIEVWYSGVGEVLRLQNGRVVGATGSRTEWSNVLFQGLPAWSEIAGEATYLRVRDVSPGYHFGLRENLKITRIQTPASSNLRELPADSLLWFDEALQNAKHWPTSRYALKVSGDLPRVMYGEHCLANDLCFSWQRWTANGALQ